MAVRAVAVPRAVRRPRELDWRLIAGAVTALLGVAGVLSVLATLVPEDRTVVVAAHELVPGSTIGPGDLTVAHVRLPDGLAAQAFSERQLPTLVGHQVSEPVHGQELVTRARLATAHGALVAGQVQLRLPLKPDSAVVEDLQPGDPVTILGTISQGKAAAGTHAVVPRALVAGVQRANPSSGAASSSAGAPLSAVTITVTQQEATAVADARANGELTILLAGPES